MMYYPTCRSPIPHREFSCALWMAFICAALVLGVALPANADSWISATSLQIPRSLSSSVLLPSGKVMIIGGTQDPFSSAASIGDQVVSTVEFYDPSNGSRSTSASQIPARSGFTATLLANGKVLVVGGTARDTTPAPPVIYDPASDSWSPAAPSPFTTGGQLAALLADGKVMIVPTSTLRDAAYANQLPCNSGPYLYDPVADAWSTVPSPPGTCSSNIPAALNFAGAALGFRPETLSVLTDGRVMLLGAAYPQIGAPPVPSWEIYDPRTGLWDQVTNLPLPIENFVATAIANNRVLVTGGDDARIGMDSQGNNIVVYTYRRSDAFVCQPGTGCNQVASMYTPRQAYSATLLADNRVLLAGGLNGDFPRLNILGNPPYALSDYFIPTLPLASSEIYDPATNTWSETAALTTARYNHAATLLRNGQVLVSGGVAIDTTKRPPVFAIASNEIYTPNVSPAFTPQTGYWWNPAEGGRGFAIEYNGGKIYMEAYMYDATGKPVWYAAGPASLNNGNFSAPLNAYANGQTLTGGFHPASSVPSPGNVSITFSDSSHGTLTWPGGTIPIQRYQFELCPLPPNSTSISPQAGWWWNPAEGGRGYFLEMQCWNIYFNANMYDISGNATWYIAGPVDGAGTNAYMTNWTSYSGGQTLTGTYKAPTATSNAGALTIQFQSGTTALLTLPDGRQIPIQRYSF